MKSSTRKLGSNSFHPHRLLFALLGSKFLRLGFALTSIHFTNTLQAAPPSIEISTGAHFRYDSNFDTKDQTSASLPDTDPYRFRLTPQIALRTSESSSITTRVRAQYSRSGDQGADHVFIDKWVFEQQFENGQLSLGRNNYPFWQQNDLFWDGDATPAGAFASNTFINKEHTLTLSGGYFYLPKSDYDFEDTLTAAQVVLNKGIGDFAWTLASGFNAISGRHSSPNFNVFTSSIQTETKILDRSLAVGLDYYHNTSSDSPAPSLTGEDSAYIASISWGSIETRGDWSIGSSYAIVEENSVYTPYSQGDWLKFDADNGPSGLNGSAFWFKYALTESTTLTSQWFVRDARGNSQSSNRLRFELNSSF